MLQGGGMEENIPSTGKTTMTVEHIANTRTIRSVNHLTIKLHYIAVSPKSLSLVFYYDLFTSNYTFNHVYFNYYPITEIH